MNKRGFTLVELLAIIVVLAIILAVAIPTVSGIIANSTKAFFKSDVKMVLNAVKLKKLENDSFNPLEINKTNIYELLKISDINYSSVSFEFDEDKLYLRLVGQNKWQGLIACGVYSNIKVVNSDEICGLDKQAPVVTYEPDGSEEYVKSSSVIINVSDEEINPSNLKYVWTTTDTTPNDEEYTNTFTSGSNINMPLGSGIYYLHIYAEDMSKNISQTYRRYKLDNDAPVIVINGDIDITILHGTSYNDEGATAIDNVDGDVSSKIITTGTVNSTVRGTYIITYTVTDAAGNEVTANRTVNVIDVDAPVITILGNNPEIVTMGSAYLDAGATATDNADGNVTANITTTSTVNTSVAGTYYVTYTVTDAAGNEATANRTVNVIQAIYTFLYTGSTQTFVAPVTGTYELEMHGGGGSGGYYTSGYDPASGYWGTQGGGGGGGSGNVQNITLTQGQVINVSIGAGGTGNSSSGGQTTFGSYSLAGGNGGSTPNGGSGQGNLGTIGGTGSGGLFVYGAGGSGGQGNINNTAQIYGDGGQGAGFTSSGGTYNSSPGQNGAVIVKFLNP